MSSEAVAVSRPPGSTATAYTDRPDGPPVSTVSAPDCESTIATVPSSRPATTAGRPGTEARFCHARYFHGPGLIAPEARAGIEPVALDRVIGGDDGDRRPGVSDRDGIDRHDLGRVPADDLVEFPYGQPGAAAGNGHPPVTGDRERGRNIGDGGAMAQLRPGRHIPDLHSTAAVVEQDQQPAVAGDPGMAAENREPVDV